MALIKNNEDFGIPLDYWRIEEVSINRAHSFGRIVIGLYASKTAEYSVTTMTFTVDQELYEEFFGINNTYENIFNSAYECIKRVNMEKDLLDDEDEINKRKTN